MRRFLSLMFLTVALIVVATATSLALAETRFPTETRVTERVERIEAYHPRLGRTRPVIAVLGENGGTELTDFAIPYGILARADVADVFTVAIRPGPLTMRPALHIAPDATTAQFDARYPEGADYVIVPAMVNYREPALRDWLVRQSERGATIVSICDGALVVANAGLLDGHRATAHWATLGHRRKTYRHVNWIENARYVADGHIVSSAGISAAIPTTLALVEAIAGYDKAAEVARRVAVRDWSASHNSQVFAPNSARNLAAFATTNLVNKWLYREQAIGVAIAPGVDEIALALTADAYTRSGRGKVYSVAASAGPVRSASGLRFLPDRTGDGARGLTRFVGVPAQQGAPMMDTVLASIARDYGRRTAFGVALDFEYPGFHD